MPGSVRAGIVGTGFMGRVHAHAVRAAGGQVAAVAGSTPASSQQAAGRLGWGRGADTLDGMLRSVDIDVIHVCTTNYLHAEQALAVVKAGKHDLSDRERIWAGTQASKAEGDRHKGPDDASSAAPIRRPQNAR
jgi:prephenate dehydrogenase